MNRRNFLIQAGILSASTLTAIGTHAWVAKSTTLDTSNNGQKRLIVIFLRGAVDGLNIVVPYSETAYYEARPRIAIPQPGKEDGALNLDNRFGLHPALSPLMPFWQQGSLAFVHASGSPDPTRSHFDAQTYMETGTPGLNRTEDGWMNRLLAVLSGHTPVQAVSVGATVPLILSGQVPVANLPLGNNRSPLDRKEVGEAFDRLYSGKDELSHAYQESREANQVLSKDINTEMKMANNGAPLPNGFSRDAQRLAQAMVADPRIQLGFMALGGWDTHVNEGGSKGQLANNLGRLGQGLATLASSLGSAYPDTTIVVMSEFGRTVHENGDGGTDHGHGNVMWLLGGIRGGIYGQWPGLASNQLYQGRDLAITTDFRDVIATLLAGHMGLSDGKLNQILPNYTPKQKIALI